MALALYQIARGLAEGAIDALIDRGPAIIAMIRSANTQTIAQAPAVPQDLKDALDKETADAMAAVDARNRAAGT